ncbi:hypothetical protein TpMuguga_02g00534 [Theileria parva strain Muguga]|uniref:Uncharacterized protein n=1 Tax=Theileria parva TaxID=5875 RepID=Q4N4V6_THEPA|nr:uncharacterized protein TpMuguga_02g00534 [Theileria parva strain Muguga]EAN32817.1 hypothetical protein TpMuguga_02g00534 [Theileria parva strain Muguga]|eukprot:XP_765100.1 hypothetical protein [Theileria parva strain Muguga]
MKVNWESFSCLQLYNKYSTKYRKTPSDIVNHILSYLNTHNITEFSDSEGMDPEYTEGTDGMEKRKLNHTNNPKINKIRKINYTQNVNYFNGTESDTTPETTPDSSPRATPGSTPENTPTETPLTNGSDLIFDMKYCSLQLPIPLELYAEDDTYTLETDQDELIRNFDICYDEELESNLILAEPFRFLCKVHITFDDQFGHQWCCCYFDARGNYTKKRFNTSDLQFDTAKMLAHRCKEAAEHSFHNIWILKHKNELNQPIPNNLTNSLINIIHRVKTELNSQQCPNCSINNIKHILHNH